MKNRRNYYRVLHVGPEAPAAVIQASYRTLMQRLKMHPDLGGDHAGAALINEAYATLSDPARRQAYDLTLASATQQRREARHAVPPRTPAPPTPPRATGPLSTTACSFCGASSPAGRAESKEGLCATCASPLRSGPRHEAAEESRRAIERVPRNMPVTFYSARFPDLACSGTTEDVSLRGMRLLSGSSIQVGDRLKIECAFCSAVAIVRSVRPHRDRARGPWVCGVEFLTLRISQQRGGLISTLA